MQRGQKIQTKKNRDPSVIQLSKYNDKRVYVKFQGGREVSGVLKGSDQIYNLVLDDAIEYLKDPNDPSVMSDKTRELGLVVVRGSTILVISPADVMEPIENPFSLEDAA